MKLELDLRGVDSFSISQVDGSGNGIIVCSGKFEGGSSDVDRLPRVAVLVEMVSLWNDF